MYYVVLYQIPKCLHNRDDTRFIIPAEHRFTSRVDIAIFGNYRLNIIARSDGIQMCAKHKHRRGATVAFSFGNQVAAITADCAAGTVFSYDTAQALQSRYQIIGPCPFIAAPRTNPAQIDEFRQHSFWSIMFPPHPPAADSDNAGR